MSFLSFILINLLLHDIEQIVFAIDDHQHQYHLQSYENANQLKEENTDRKIIKLGETKLIGGSHMVLWGDPDAICPPSDHDCPPCIECVDSIDEDEIVNHGVFVLQEPDQEIVGKWVHNMIDKFKIKHNDDNKTALSVASAEGGFSKSNQLQCCNALNDAQQTSSTKSAEIDALTTESQAKEKEIEKLRSALEDKDGNGALAKCEEELAKTNEEQFAKCQQSLGELQKQLSEAQANAKRLTEQIVELKEKAETPRAELTALETSALIAREENPELEKENEELQQLEERLSEEEKRKEVLETEIEELRRQLGEKEEAMRECQREREALQREQTGESDAEKERIRRLEQENAELTRQAEDKQSEIHELQKQLDAAQKSLQDETTKFATNAKTNEEAVAKYQHSLDEGQKQLREAEENVKRLQEQIVELKEKAETPRAQLKASEASAFTREENSELEKENEELKQEKERLSAAEEEKTSRLETQIAELKGQLAVKQEEMQKYEQKNEAMREKIGAFTVDQSSLQEEARRLKEVAAKAARTLQEMDGEHQSRANELAKSVQELEKIQKRSKELEEEVKKHEAESLSRLKTIEQEQAHIHKWFGSFDNAMQVFNEFQNQKVRAVLECGLIKSFHEGPSFLNGFLQVVNKCSDKRVISDGKEMLIQLRKEAAVEQRAYVWDYCDSCKYLTIDENTNAALFLTKLIETVLTNKNHMIDRAYAIITLTSVISSCKKDYPTYLQEQSFWPCLACPFADKFEDLFSTVTKVIRHFFKGYDGRDQWLTGCQIYEQSRTHPQKKSQTPPKVRPDPHYMASTQVRDNRLKQNKNDHPNMAHNMK